MQVWVCTVNVWFFISCVGDGVMKYDVMRVVTAGRHEIEVIAYCKGAPVDSEKRRFRGLLDDDM